MKKIIISLIFVITCNISFAQGTKNQKIEPIGDLLEVTIYYDDGAIMQHGFMTKEHELHASWESYYANGNRKCVAIYDHGKKVGTWYYWYDNKITKVQYENNKVIGVEDFDYENINLDNI